MAPWGDREIGGLSSHLLSLEKVIALTGNQSVLSSHAGIPKRVQDMCWFLARILPGSQRSTWVRLVEMVHGVLALRHALQGDTAMVHAHTVTCLGPARWIARLLGVPVVLTVHSQYTLEDIALGVLRRGSHDEEALWALEARAYRDADRVFTVTGRLREFVIMEGHANPARVTVRLNFVDTEEFRPRDPRAARDVLTQAGVRLGAPEGDGHHMVLYPGRLSPRKGVDILIRAAQRVTQEDPGARFLITGDGPQLPELLTLRKSLGLDSVVSFAGNIPGELVKYLYNVADVVVIPSVTIEGAEEGTPMSALEAMASGVPLIASAVGGLTEILTDGVTGHLVPEGSPERLADCILAALNEDQTEITARAVQYVRASRSLESYAKDLKAFLDSTASWSTARGGQRGTATSSRMNR